MAWNTIVEGNSTFYTRQGTLFVSPKQILNTSIAHVLFFEDVVIKQFIPKYSESEFRKEKRILKYIENTPLQNLFCAGQVIPTLAIQMERYDGDLSLFVQTDSGKELLPVVLAHLKTMTKHHLLYTDLKPQNVLFRKQDERAPKIVFCDYSACCLLHDTWSCQTFPYPGDRTTKFFHKDDYDGTIGKASEQTVVWNFAVFWLIMLGYEQIVYEYLCYTTLTQRSLRAFKRLGLVLPAGLKSILYQQTTRLDEVRIT
jgi:serine/threonine protein kinase